MIYMYVLYINTTINYIIHQKCIRNAAGTAIGQLLPNDYKSQYNPINTKVTATSTENISCHLKSTWKDPVIGH